MRKFKNRIVFLNRCLKHFGFFKGLGIFVRLNFGTSGKVHLPGHLSPLNFRPKNRSDIYTFQEIFILKDYDQNFAREVEYIVDAGANIGFSSIFFALKYPNATILSLEPDPGNFELLQKNCSVYKNVKTINAALWDTDTKLDILNPDAHERSYIMGNTGNSKSVTAFSPQTILKNNDFPRIDIFKIDIEGSEKEVFESDTEWLAITNVLIVEVHDKMKPGSSRAVFSAISGFNYHFAMKGENLIFYKPE